MPVVAVESNPKGQNTTTGRKEQYAMTAQTDSRHRIMDIQTYAEEWVRGDLDGQEMVVDILTALRHFCDHHAVEWGKADTLAHSHYLNELAQSRRV